MKRIFESSNIKSLGGKIVEGTGSSGSAKKCTYFVEAEPVGAESLLVLWQWVRT